jgi:tetratricopeptide (TPR) repeat protein
MRIYSSLIAILLSISLYSQPSTDDVYKARAEFRLGVQKGVEHDFQGALHHFTEAIELNPIYAEAFLYRGLAFNEVNGFDSAIKDLTICIELDPKFSDQAHFFRGIAKVGLGNYNGAIQDYTTAIQLNPDFIAYFRRGQANMFLEEYARALQDFEIALRLNPSLTEGYLYRGMALYHLGLNNEALRDLRRAATDLKSNTDAFYFSALARIATKDYYASIRDLDKTIELNPQMADAYKARALAYKETGNNVKAKEDLDVFENLTKQQTEITITHQDNTISQKEEITKPEVEKPLPDFAELFKSRDKAETVAIEKESEANREAIELTKIVTPVPAPVENKNQQNVGNSEKQTKAKTEITTHNSDSFPETTTNSLNDIDSGFYNKMMNSSSPKGFGVQIASYTNTDNLLSLASAYESQFNTKCFIQVTIVNGRRIYRLIAGEFSNRINAEQFRDELRLGDFPDCFLVVYERLN